MSYVIDGSPTKAFGDDDIGFGEVRFSKLKREMKMSGPAADEFIAASPVEEELANGRFLWPRRQKP